MRPRYNRDGRLCTVRFTWMKQLLVLLLFIIHILHLEAALRSLRTAAAAKSELLSTGEGGGEAVIDSSGEIDSDDYKSGDHLIIQDIRVLMNARGTGRGVDGGGDKASLNNDSGAQEGQEQQESLERHHRHLEASLNRLSFPARMAMQRLDRARAGMTGPFAYLPWVSMKGRKKERQRPSYVSCVHLAAASHCLLVSHR